MPIYTYKCKKCNKEIKVRLNYSDVPPNNCKENECNGDLEKIYKPSSFSLKGSGWFKDGY